MSASSRVAIIGGGILGLAHAYLATQRGHRVTLFERSGQASGASVRNFGMIWPIGQAAGEMHRLALRSRELWLKMLARTGMPWRATGSLHVAHHDDEADVLREFAERSPAQGYRCKWLRPAEVARRSEAVEPEGLKGGLWSATELTVDPRLVSAKLAEVLAAEGAEIRFGTAVRSIELPRLETSAGLFEADAAIVCSGDDFSTLYPEMLAASGLTRCKLQMMRTAPQPDGWELGPALAAGLTLRFYKAFQMCSTLARLQERVAREKAEYDRRGIHVLVSQTADGAITLGDSHEYGANVDIFDKTAIDDLVLQEARTFLRLPEWRIAERWHGVYSLHPDKPYFQAAPSHCVQVITGTGGSGMTLSFGIAERALEGMGL